MDYLQDLGVKCPLPDSDFLPVHLQSKYDISDYYAVDEHFWLSCQPQGPLIHQAHAGGMKIILDAVFNHSSDRHPYFQDVVEKETVRLLWLVYDPGERASIQKNQLWNLRLCPLLMPKWNTSHPAVQAYLIDVGLYWMQEFDIDGWRLDVSDEVSHDFWRLFH